MPTDPLEQLMAVGDEQTTRLRNHGHIGMADPRHKHYSGLGGLFRVHDVCS